MWSIFMLKKRNITGVKVHYWNLKQIPVVLSFTVEQIIGQKNTLREWAYRGLSSLQET